ncbi:hypothetical protein F0344_04090 [Streptomyces finlayi]|uniref:Uncharacterized protein n=1 Tax=Streptomyces finlayi TaxID=67296 RepID=A0A7G7BEX4_9ACTN|nr:hypothetical protein [Streptomyces finlayi]QNE73889.1 hypothetical protein F0344_04090 [Streptomyces finlayi]
MTKAPFAPGPGGGPTPSVAAVVSGPPGKGETTLALHAAREPTDRFPGGQLVLGLRGTEDDLARGRAATAPRHAGGKAL